MTIVKKTKGESSLNFLDLFAGGGGLSEGFIQAGFDPVAHVDSDRSACFTLRTRMVYHWLKKENQLSTYSDYLHGGLSRTELYQKAPQEIVQSVINERIGRKTASRIFEKVDALLKGQNLDLIVGGPPCQAYSLVGRSRDSLRMRKDVRNYLYPHYAEFLGKYQPRYFIFENVAGLLSARDGDGDGYLNKMQDLFNEYGYETEYKVLSANEYGVLQRRKRVFLVGRKGKQTGFYPEPDEWKPETTVDKLFSGLPAICAGGGQPGPCEMEEYDGVWQIEAGVRDDQLPVTWHQARPHSVQDLEIYRLVVEKWNSKNSRLKYGDLPERLKTHRNVTSFTDRFKVVAGDLPYSHTVVAHIAKDGHYYIHPDLEQNRSITPREAARLQSFPDNYYFESTSGRPARTPAFSQIGNAVPVLLARKLAEKLKDTWQ